MVSAHDIRKILSKDMDITVIKVTLNVNYAMVGDRRIYVYVYIARPDPVLTRSHHTSELLPLQFFIFPFLMQ